MEGILTWRNEPLTKGEMYDALMNAASSVEAQVSAAVKHIHFPGIHKLVDPITTISTNVIRAAAEGISGDKAEESEVFVYCPNLELHPRHFWTTRTNTTHECGGREIDGM
jgi:hypothetical protein